jgi:NAD-dependent SIR2 family protein deacetylase
MKKRNTNFRKIFSVVVLSSAFQKDFVVSLSTGNSAEQLPVSLESIAEKFAESSFKNVLVLVGAGVSVSAGIPDFRTPGTGLYSKLEEYNLPFPEAIFELDYFRQNPFPFIELSKAIWPGQPDGPKPTLGHAFLKLLQEQGALRRVYTQNIDGLESLAGVDDEKLVECHGNFRSCSCTSPKCRAQMPDSKECQQSFMNGSVYPCPKCGSPVKPEVVFFGEELPMRFQDLIDDDVDSCDLLIVMGTSLLVAPVATIPRWVGKNVPRVLINRELVGDFRTQAAIRKAALDKEGLPPIRDVFVEGDCDDAVRVFSQAIGHDWEQALLQIHRSNQGDTEQ